MTDKKISELNALTDADGVDVLPIVDTSESETKKITFSNLFGGYVPYTGATSALNLGANNLTVDTNVLFVDATNDRVGIGTVAPATKLDVAGNIRISADSQYQIGTRHALSLPVGGLHTIAGRAAGSTWTAWSAGTYVLNDLVTHDGSGTFKFYRAKTTTTKEPGVDVDWADDWTDLGTHLAQSTFGYFAGRDNTGTNQQAFGYFAGRDNTGAQQSAFGYAAGHSNTGTNQSAFGYLAGHSNTGDRVTGIGYEATRGNTANDVVAIGYEAGKDNSTANQFIVQQANVNATPLIQGNFSTGNVGIGTVAPDEKLEVNGNIKTNGVITWNGGGSADTNTHIASGAIHYADAAADSKLYGRKNNAWEEVEEVTGGNFQVFHASLSCSIASATRFFRIFGHNITHDSIEGNCETLITKTGTLKNFHVKFNNNSVAADQVFTVRKNGANTDITVTVTSGSTALFSDTSNEASCALTDVITISNASSASGTNARAAMALEIHYD